MKTQLLNGQFVFNTGSVKFSSVTDKKWNWELFDHNGIKMNSTTTDSVTIALAKDLLDEAIVRHDKPVS